MALYTLYNEYQSPPSEDTQFYGCAKPTTTSTLTNFGISGSLHDVTYSYVTFTGNAGSGYGSKTTTGMKLSSGSIYNIVYDHCVFATSTGSGGQANAFHAICSGGVIYNVTFTNCWFEPYSRFGVELNGRGGWMHDFTFDHCTFEAGLGEALSVDMSFGNYTPGTGDTPYGVTVGGVVRGFEGLSVTNCLFEGTGVPSVSDYTNPLGTETSGRMGLEFGCVYPYASDNAVGRSEFSRNKVGRCYSAWYQTNYSGASYMTFTDNVFDDSYNDHACPSLAGTAISGQSVSHCTFTGNTYRLGTSHSTIFVSGYDGTANAYSGDRWYSDRSALTANFAFTDSTYEDCDFYLPSSVTLASGSTYDAACYFKNGHTGGTPA